MSGDTICPYCGMFNGQHSLGCDWTAQVPVFGTVELRNGPGERLLDMMTEYLGDIVFAKRFFDCMEMIRRKNADYTQGVEKRDRIAAFRRIGGDIDIPMTKVWAIFAQKHWGAVMKFVKDGQVESEPIDGRINDLINYFVLLGAIIHDGEEE